MNQRLEETKRALAALNQPVDMALGSNFGDEDPLAEHDKHMRNVGASVISALDAHHAKDPIAAQHHMAQAAKHIQYADSSLDKMSPEEHERLQAEWDAKPEWKDAFAKALAREFEAADKRGHVHHPNETSGEGIYHVGRPV